MTPATQGKAGALVKAIAVSVVAGIITMIIYNKFIKPKVEKTNPTA